MDKINELIRLINNSNFIVALTGAGVSRLSGIPDFRGGYNPIWDKYPQDKVFNIDYFYDSPELFYNFLREILKNEYKPNIIHFTLKKLEDKRNLKAIITQNIDGFHRVVGSKNVFELHGTIYKNCCIKCDSQIDYEAFVNKLYSENIPRCRCGGIIRPKVVFFGESLPEDDLKNAIYFAKNADLMIVLGTSLVVQPAATIPLYTLNNNGKIIIINRQKTYLDEYAYLKFNDLESVFNYISKNLD